MAIVAFEPPLTVLAAIFFFCASAVVFPVFWLKLRAFDASYNPPIWLVWAVRVWCAIGGILMVVFAVQEIMHIPPHL